MDKSNFYINIHDKVEQIKEIIGVPMLFDKNFNSVIEMHRSIINDIEIYNENAKQQIKKDLIELIKPQLESYKLKAKEEIKSHKIEYNNFLPLFRDEIILLDHNLDEEKFDELLTYIDLTIDPKQINKKQLKMIKNYMECKDEILENYENLLNNINIFESTMINERQNLFSSLMNEIVPKLYKIHLSYVKNTLKQKLNSVDKKDVKININNVDYNISEKQSDFIISSLKKYLMI